MARIATDVDGCRCDAALPTTRHTADRALINSSTMRRPWVAGPHAVSPPARASDDRKLPAVTALTLRGAVQGGSPNRPYQILQVFWRAVLWSRCSTQPPVIDAQNSCAEIGKPTDLARSLLRVRTDGRSHSRAARWRYNPCPPRAPLFVGASRSARCLHFMTQMLAILANGSSVGTQGFPNAWKPNGAAPDAHRPVERSHLTAPNMAKNPPPAA